MSSEKNQTTGSNMHFERPAAAVQIACFLWLVGMIVVTYTGTA